MTNFADIDLRDVQIIIDGVVMRPRAVNVSEVEYNAYDGAPILRLEMELNMAEYTHNRMRGIKVAPTRPRRALSIVNVIFNEPATIVFWSDQSKTVVRAQNGEPFDPEKGLAVAILKRMRGNKGNYNNVFHRWTRGYQPKKISK